MREELQRKRDDCLYHINAARHYAAQTWRGEGVVSLETNRARLWELKLAEIDAQIRALPVDEKKL